VRLQSWTINASCDVSFEKGEDGIPCTEDDPGRPSGSAENARRSVWRATALDQDFLVRWGNGSAAAPNETPHERGAAPGEEFVVGGAGYYYNSRIEFLLGEMTLRLTTGRAGADISDADAELGVDLGVDSPCGLLPCETCTASPCDVEVQGAPLSCAALAEGVLDATLVGAAAALDRRGIGDLIATFTLAAARPDCAGDCNEDRTVTVNELIQGVSISSGGQSLDQCALLDADGNQQISVDELIAAVNAALSGCAA
jgi:hypothetical protein